MFEMRFPTKIIFGQNCVHQVGAEACEYGDRALLVTGRSAMREAGVIGKITDLLKASGFDVALQEAQSAKTLLLLRIFDVCIPLLTSAAAILIMMTYSITEQRAYEIRNELEQRRGKIT